MEPETSMEDFFDGMSDDYQSEDMADETSTETDVADELTDAMQEDDTAPQKEEISEGTDESPNEEKPTEEKQEPQTYVLRVNHEDKTVTHEELMNYAQMGVDYNRVKTQLEQAKNDNSGLQSQIAEMQGVFDVVKDLAEASKIPVSDLLKQFRKTRYTSIGYSDREAELAVERDDFAKERDSLRDVKPAAQEDGNERAKRDVAEFRQKFPDISLTEELVNKLIPSVNEGMSLTDAYQKMRMEEREAEIAELKAKLAAEQQNAANRQSSPGSLKDGGKKQKTDQYDDFFNQF